MNIQTIGITVYFQVNSHHVNYLYLLIVKPTPSVSILMTVFNTIEYVEEAIDSILKQTFSEWELILVDDGSTAATVEFLTALQRKINDSRIRFLPITHVGRAQALNYGLAQAQAEWIAILDADDAWHPDKLALQWCSLAQDPNAIFTTKTGLFKTQEDIKSLLNKTPTPAEFLRLNSKKMLLSNFVSHSAVLFKKAGRSYNETLRSQIDYDLWMRCIKNKANIVYLPIELTYHRIHSNQSFEGRAKMRYRFSFLKLRLHYAVQLRCFGFIPFILGHFILGLFINQRLKHRILQTLKTNL